MKTNKTGWIFLLLIWSIFLSDNSLSAVTLTETVKKISNNNQGKEVVNGVDGWLFLKEELEHVAAGKFWGEYGAKVSRSKKKKFADPVPAIIAYNQELNKKGITLYLVPVPPKALIYPDKLTDELSSEDGQEQLDLYHDFYGLLEKEGVKVIDMLPVLRQARKDNKAKLYCQTDSHFSPAGIELFAQTIADNIKKEDWFKKIEKKKYQKREDNISITGDLAVMAKLDEAKEDIDISFVTVETTGKPEESDNKSPVILLGDSHTLVFHSGGDLHAKAGGLFDHLSAKLGFPLDLIGVRGSGVNPARIKLYQKNKKDSSCMDGKKAVIWCFTARDFTGSGGWRNIPVSP